MRILILLVLLLSSTLTFCETYDIEQACQKCNELNLHMPKPQEDGRIQTLNQKGAMSMGLDEATKQFIEFSKGKTVLEIGGAYGKIMTTVLKKHSEVVYHLNDLDQRHLFIAACQAKSEHLTEDSLKNILFISGDIVSGFESSVSYDAILVARVLHFFSPSQMQSAIHHMFHLLRAGGRVYVVAITPYVKRYERFIPEYEKRVAQGDPYPGYVQSLKDWLNTSVTSVSQISTISEEPFMFLDSQVLSRVFREAGFNVLEAKMVELPYDSSSWSLDGRENVILIAEKL